jgi:hypothetical protein
MPAADRLPNLLLAATLALAIPLAAVAAESETGYVWTGGETEKGFATLVYGSPETAEDLLFWIHCDMKKQTTEMTVYVDNPGTKVGDAVTIELSAGAAKLPVKGKIATDEMSGFLFAEARNFKVKPVIELLKPKGPASVKTGNVVTALPDEGRAAAVSEFAKACKLD